LPLLKLCGEEKAAGFAMGAGFETGAQQVQTLMRFNV
jgi:hypothetical protein